MAVKNSTNWLELDQIHADDLSMHQRQWLTDGASLTKRLHQTFKEQVRLCLKYAKLDNIYPDEHALLDLNDRQVHWVREIEWRFYKHLLIAARVIIPAGYASPSMQQLYQAGAVSIGDILFGEGGFTREKILLAKLTSTHPYYQLANTENDQKSYLWARRSIFCRESERLLVSEVFLPKFFSLVAEKA